MSAPDYKFFFENQIKDSSQLQIELVKRSILTVEKLDILFDPNYKRKEGETVLTVLIEPLTKLINKISEKLASIRDDLNDERNTSKDKLVSAVLDTWNGNKGVLPTVEKILKLYEHPTFSLSGKVNNMNFLVTNTGMFSNKNLMNKEQFNFAVNQLKLFIATFRPGSVLYTVRIAAPKDTLKNKRSDLQDKILLLEDLLDVIETNIDGLRHSDKIQVKDTKEVEALLNSNLDLVVRMKKSFLDLERQKLAAEREKKTKDAAEAAMRTEKQRKEKILVKIKEDNDIITEEDEKRKGPSLSTTKKKPSVVQAKSSTLDPTQKPKQKPLGVEPQLSNSEKEKKAALSKERTARYTEMIRKKNEALRIAGQRRKAKNQFIKDIERFFVFTQRSHDLSLPELDNYPVLKTKLSTEFKRLLTALNSSYKPAYLNTELEKGINAGYLTEEDAEKYRQRFVSLEAELSTLKTNIMQSGDILDVSIEIKNIVNDLKQVLFNMDKYSDVTKLDPGVFVTEILSDLKVQRRIREIFKNNIATALKSSVEYEKYAVKLYDLVDNTPFEKLFKISINFFRKRAQEDEFDTRDDFEIYGRGNLEQTRNYYLNKFGKKAPKVDRTVMEPQIQPTNNAIRVAITMAQVAGDVRDYQDIINQVRYQLDYGNKEIDGIKATNYWWYNIYLGITTSERVTNTATYAYDSVSNKYVVQTATENNTQRGALGTTGRKKRVSGVQPGYGFSVNTTGTLHGVVPVPAHLNASKRIYTRREYAQLDKVHYPIKRDPSKSIQRRLMYSDILEARLALMTFSKLAPFWEIMENGSSYAESNLDRSSFMSKLGKGKLVSALRFQGTKFVKNSERDIRNYLVQQINLKLLNVAKIVKQGSNSINYEMQAYRTSIVESIQKLEQLLSSISLMDSPTAILNMIPSDIAKLLPKISSSVSISSRGYLTYIQRVLDLLGGALGGELSNTREFNFFTTIANASGDTDRRTSVIRIKRLVSTIRNQQELAQDAYNNIVKITGNWNELHNVAENLSKRKRRR